ncbi:hypothetical protein Bca52824_048868 [Brassica carinata]|uniref:Uncharacterized protein n=1 Tax=Brassica carinata TaxID=52824 RepID=A0A8X7RHJ9_BRACI|nr:hypothetical protein Bca52824_048868 [Brassica carinata]
MAHLGHRLQDMEVGMLRMSTGSNNIGAKQREPMRLRAMEHRNGTNDSRGNGKKLANTIGTPSCIAVHNEENVMDMDIVGSSSFMTSDHTTRMECDVDGDDLLGDELIERESGGASLERMDSAKAFESFASRGRKALVWKDLRVELDGRGGRDGHGFSTSAKEGGEEDATTAKWRKNMEERKIWWRRQQRAGPSSGVERTMTMASSRAGFVGQPAPPTRG